MLTGGSEATGHLWAAFAKSGREAAPSTATQIHPYINVMGGSLTIPPYDSLSKGRVGGIHPSTARLGTMMIRDAYGWHDICFYVVEDDVDRASVVSMDGPVEPLEGCLFVRGDERGPMSPLQGASDETLSNSIPPTREGTMAR